MTKLKKALASVLKSLGVQEKLLARAQRRYKVNRKRAYRADQQKQAAEKRADQLRAEATKCFTYGPNEDQAKGERLRRHAERCDKEARRHAHVAYANHLRAQHFLGVTKVLQQRINKLDTSAASYEAKIKANKARVKGDKIVGGTARQRLRLAIHTAAHNCAIGAQNNYYSMTGAARAYLKTLAGYPHGHIWDCSTFADGCYIVCDLQAPSGPNTLNAGGWTGTEGEHGKRVSEAQAKTGDLVLYGPAPHHHVEVVDDPKAKTTIGHGSPPIDAGVFDLFGDGDYEIRSYLY